MNATQNISRTEAMVFLATHQFVPLTETDRMGLQGAGENAFKFEDEETQNFWVFNPGEGENEIFECPPRLECFTFDGRGWSWVLA